MKNNNIKKYVLILIICVFLYFLIDTILFNIKKEPKNSNKVRINYIVTDYEKTKKSNFDVFSSYGDAIVYMYTSTIDLKKEKSYYVATAKDINTSFFDNVVNSTFALNDVEGNVIDDANYDKSTHKLKIPSKYFSSKNMKNYGGVPVKLELISRVKKNKYTYNKIPVKIEKIIPNQKYVYMNSYNDYPEFSIFEYKKGMYINKSDFKIYINGKSEPLDEKLYTYDRKTGVIKLKFYPYYINNIRVKFNKISLIKNKLFSILLFYKNVEAAKKVNATASFSSTENKKTGSFLVGTEDSATVEYYYRHGDGTYRHGNGSTVTDVSSSTAIENIFDDAIGISESEPAAYQDFAVKVGTLSFSKTFTYEVCDNNGENCEEKNGTASLSIPINKWLLLWCYHTKAKTDVNGALKIKFKIKSFSNNVYTISAEASEAVATQTAKGEFDVTGDNPANIVIQKKINDTGTPVSSSTSKIVFRLYKEDVRSTDPQKGCKGLIAQKTTNSSGKAKFNGLKPNTTYCVKEIFKESSSNSALRMVDYYRDASCDGVAETEYNHNDGDKVKLVTTGAAGTTVGTDGSIAYCNVTKRYTTAIKKVDADTSENLEGFTFGLSGTGYSTITDTNGYGQICNIWPYQSYTFTENAQAAQYWGSTGSVVVNAPVYEFGGEGSGEWLPDYDGSNTQTAYNSILHPYPISATCPSILGQETGTFQNTHKFYCIKIKKIDADTNTVLGGATFKADGTGVSLTKGSTLAYRNTNAKSVYSENTTTGITTILTADHNENFKITETAAPEGYAASTDTPNATPTLIGNGKKWSEITFEDCDAYLPDSSAAVVIMKNTALNINWYKVSENKTKSIKDAQFKAAFINTDGTTKAIYHKANKETTTDSKGNSRNCYVYSATSTGNGSDIFVADADGQVCVRGVPKGSYRVTETLPGQNHAFGSVITKDLVASNEFEARDDTTAEANKFINIPTYFEFDKSIAEVDGGDKQLSYLNGTSGTLDDILASISTEELKKLDFQIFESDSNGNITNNTALTFEKYMKDNKPYYSYSGNEDTLSTMNITADETTTILHLDDLRKIRVEHLPWGSNGTAKYYVIREVNTTTCGGSDTDCIGYYYPDYSKRGSVFSISTCTNDDSNTTVCQGTLKHATQSLENVPTSIEFTKRDFYHYEDAEDKNNTTQAEFEDANERNEFDRIVFKLKHNGSYMKLVYLGNESSDPNRPNPDCTSDTDYALYKYVPSVENYSLETTEELHTCGGHLRITNLCRGEDYQIEEISVPEDSVYVKENTNSTPTVVDYKIPCTEGEKVKKKSTTNVIDDKGTRVRFEKRDSKYGYLIPDETTTFEVYRCPKDSNGNYTTCNPSNYSTVEEREAAGMKLMKFQSRRVISTTFTEVNENGNISTITRTDEEDPYGAMGEYGVEVYKSMSDSDAEKYNKLCTSAYEDGCYVTDLHPHRGILVLRYLPANYNYVLLETIAPRNYTLPKGINAETPFTVSNQTVSVDEVDVPNKPTSLVIRKYDENMSLITGAKFRIYEKTGNDKSCDYNLSPMNQPKTQLKLKTVYEGIYEARNDTDTGVITTCTNRTLSDGTVRNCNELTGTLTAEQYADRWMGFKTENVLKSPDNVDLKGENGIETYTQIQEGEALVQYLEYGHCYIIEEIEAPNGYSLPKKVADRWTMIQIEENDEYDHSTFESLVNLPTPFQFYKYDEFNQLLDGAKFKLQKLNKEKKYEDITVRENEEKEEKTKDKDGNITQKIYEVDDTTDNLTIETLNGTAIIYKLAAGQYRVVETEPAPGKELGKNLNVATFFVNKDGQVFGNRIISNKKKTEKIKRVMSDSAELIVNIQTGQSIVRYGIFIAILVAGIAGLMLYNNRKK